MFALLKEAMPVHAFSEGGANELINATTDTAEETEVDLLHFLAFGSEFWWVNQAMAVDKTDPLLCE